MTNLPKTWKRKPIPQHKELTDPKYRPKTIKERINLTKEKEAEKEIKEYVSNKSLFDLQD